MLEEVTELYLKENTNVPILDMLSMTNEQLNSRAELIIKQFNECKILDKNVNGELTQGENISDFGGLKVAYDALQKKIKRKNNSNKIEGMTPEQRFFISWGHIWRCNIRDETQLLHLAIDPHSPCKLRINMPLSNMEEFYNAFDIKEGDEMYRKNRFELW